MKKVALALLLAMSSSTVAPFAYSPVAAQAINDDVNITAEFKDTSLTDTLDALSSLSGVPVIINGDLKNSVTMRFNGMPFTKVLNYLSMAFNFTWVEKDGVIIVSQTTNMTITKSFKVKHMDLENLKKELGTFIETSKIVTNADDSTITVDSNQTNLAKVEQILKERDVKQKQVTIQAKMIEINKGDEEKLGLKYSWNTFDSAYEDKNKTPWKFNYIASADANRDLSNSKVIARPTITTLNGREAKINLADQVPIISKTISNGQSTSTVDYKNVGVTLTVTPRVNDESGLVTMKIDPVVSVITKTIETTDVTAPQISTREATTNVRVRSGETIVIGGLLKSDDIEAMSKIPFLGDMPLIGKLFSNKSTQKRNSEVVILITPVVENDEGTDVPDDSTSEVVPHTMKDKNAMANETADIHAGIKTKKKLPL